MMKTNYILESKILKIFFQENNSKKMKNYINSFYILHHKILKIKEEQKINSAFLLIQFLNKHINKCQKSICNCKLFAVFLNNGKKVKLTIEEINKFIPELLIILNYLFECAFIDYDYYNNYNMCILLAEHYCHCKNNPIMSFSLINTFILRHRNKLSKFEIVNLYELSQKYIYYLNCANIINIEKEILSDNKELLIKTQKDEEFKGYYINLKTIYKAKGYISDYIYNEMRILKYKYIFEDSLSFTYDENYENIISVKINFFENISKINDDDLYGKYRNKIINYNKSNLYNIIKLIKSDQIFYQKIINTINLLDVNRGIPIDMIFKYILFFDIFEGGKMPNIFKDKFFKLFDKDSNLYNNYITKNEYDILKKRYNEKNNKKDSEMYVIIELKRELVIKYFSEYGALKLGFEQKDIISQKLDKLMPVEFCKSHQNLIKHLIINRQTSLNFSKQIFFFDKTCTILYPVNLEVLFIYSLSKSLLFLIVSKFILEKQYIFLLNNNFELLANSKNFENEYYLNQNILQAFNISLINLLKIKPELFNKKFKKELNYIHHQKIIRQIKTDEYFVPQLYVPPGGSTISMVNQNFFNISKNNIISKISNEEDQEGHLNINEIHIQDDEEKKRLIVKNNIKASLSELLNKSEKIVFHKIFNCLINKGDFIENIAKELSKIPENDLLLENDKIKSDLIMSSKQLISKLLAGGEIFNECMKIKIRFSFYYDKQYYFIYVEDEKKLYSNSLHFMNTNNLEEKSSSKLINYKNKIPYNKNYNKSLSRNKIKSVEKTSRQYIMEKKNELNQFISRQINFKLKKNDEILNKINNKRKNINRDSFIKIIKWILTFVIGFILVIYIIIIFFQRYLLIISRSMLFAYFYNAHIKVIILYAHSRTIQIFYDYYNLTDNKILTEQEYQNIINGEADTIKENYHAFKNLYFEYNLKLGKDFHLL